MRNIFDPNSKLPYSISRSKIDFFLECPRCFYFDRRRGVGRPSIPAFTLNSAVDYLLKKEFDLLRQNGEAHELMKKYKIDAVPFKHKDLPIWRDDIRKYVGASFVHRETNFIVCGIIDDVWVDRDENLLIVDYKATSTTREISLEDRWKQGYKKQMEIYQWIFRRMGFQVSDTGYFVFANAGKNRPKFDGRLEFELSIVPYRGTDSWIGNTLVEIRKCLSAGSPPQTKPDCEYCSYRENFKKVESA
jgi:CRISPR/Cas system-associated exonuclease Cas4 (RecB family)